MKKAGLFLFLYFTLNLIGNIFWFVTFILDEPILGSDFLENLLLILIYNIIGIFGFIGSFILYKNLNSINKKAT